MTPIKIYSPTQGKILVVFITLSIIESIFYNCQKLFDFGILVGELLHWEISLFVIAVLDLGPSPRYLPPHSPRLQITDYEPAVKWFSENCQGRSKSSQNKPASSKHHIFNSMRWKVRFQLSYIWFYVVKSISFKMQNFFVSLQFLAAVTSLTKVEPVFDLIKGIDCSQGGYLTW